jgi:hypothetical protein
MCNDVCVLALLGLEGASIACFLREALLMRCRPPGAWRLLAALALALALALMVGGVWRGAPTRAGARYAANS